MPVLSVRLPKDLDRAVPRADRSAWVIEAIRQQLRRQRIQEIADDSAANAEQDREALADWEAATAPLPKARKPRARK